MRKLILLLILTSVLAALSVTKYRPHSIIAIRKQKSFLFQKLKNNRLISAKLKTPFLLQNVSFLK